MTITYTAEVATCKKFGCFVKLLARWRGSIYKLVWMDLLLFLFLYYSINLVYIYLLNEVSQRTFESVVYYCASYSSLIPLSFVLGFYVNLVMTRWWEQYITIPWPDSVAVFVSAHVHGQDERGRLMRRTVMRYVCLCLTIVFTMISPCVKKRFPKTKHLLDAGLLLENEKEIIETMDSAFPKYPKHWMPIIWAASIITRARQEGIIRDDFAVKTIIDELNHFRGRCGTLMYYDFISIPLVYTQVVTIAVYSFFVCSLLAHQWTEFKKDTYEGLDFYMPIFITLQFFFYMGWLKVAETLINPFGEDDDDFEVNWMIDRNLQVSYLIVDEMHHEHPELVKDQYWEEVYPNERPYESEAKREQPPEPSTAKYDRDTTPILSTIKVVNDSVSFLDKDNSRLDSTISIRSEFSKDTFQWSSQYFDGDLDPTKSNSDAIIGNSISAIESVQNITSYMNTESSEELISFKGGSTSKWPQRALETVSEEVDIEMETGEEEDFAFEEVEAETQSSYESDSDSDPFERLRRERQQQRIQRMNDFLQRHFGNSFNIALPKTVPEANNLMRIEIKKQPASFAISQTVEKVSPAKKTQEAKSNLNQQQSSVTSIDSNLRRILSNLTIAENQSNLSRSTQFTEKSSDTTPAFTAAIQKNESNTLIPAEVISPVLKDISSAKPPLSHSSTTRAKNVMFPTLNETSLSSPLNPTEPKNSRLSKIDASTSPLGSAKSLTTADSSDPDDWEVVATSNARQGQGDL